MRREDVVLLGCEPEPSLSVAGPVLAPGEAAAPFPSLRKKGCACSPAIRRVSRGKVRGSNTGIIALPITKLLLTREEGEFILTPMPEYEMWHWIHGNWVLNIFLV